jgi:hypothetical protein
VIRDRYEIELIDAFVKAGRATSVAHGKHVTASAARAMDTMRAAGLQVTDLPAAERAKWINGLPDIIGPWLFQDLQNGLSALKWTFYYNTSAVTDSSYWYAIGTDPDCTTARNAQIAAWNANTWASTATSIIWGGYGLSRSSGDKEFWAYRYRGKGIISSIYTGRPVAVDWYGVSSINPGTFSDFDSLGLVANEYFLIESEGEASTSTRTSTLQGDYSTNPIEVIPMNCPAGAVSMYGYYVYFGFALLKWNFTNA